MSSKATTTSVQVRQCEVLAQKLYGQCRDSPSAYRLLTGVIRGLRNVLSEIGDEALDDKAEIGPDQVRLLHQIVQSRHELDKLDIALALFRCTSLANDDTDAVSRFQTSIQESTQDLVRAYEAVRYAGEINASSDSHVASPVNSEGSSAWSMINSSSAASSRNSFDLRGLEERQLSDEKEAYEPTLKNVPRSSLVNSLRASGRSPSWRSPFADPLSMSFDDASRAILAEEDVDTMLGVARESTSSDTSACDQPATTEEKSSTIETEVLSFPDIEDSESIRVDSVVSEDAVDQQNTNRDDFTEMGTLRRGSQCSDKTERDPHGTSAQSPKHEDALASDTYTDALPEKPTETQSDPDLLSGECLSETSTSQCVVPQRPERQPPPPPDMVEIKPIVPEIRVNGEHTAITRPVSPTGSDLSEDLYSSTPPLRPRPEPQTENAYPSPLKLPEKLARQRSVSLSDEDSSRESSAEEHRRHSISVPRTQRIPRKELPNYRSTSPGKPQDHGAYNSSQHHSAGSKCSDLPVGKEKLGLSRSKYLQERRRSAPSNPSPSSVTKIENDMTPSVSSIDTISEKTPALQRNANISRWTPRKSVDEALNARMDSVKANHRPKESLNHAGKMHYGSWFERDAHLAQLAIFDQERVSAIVQLWNASQWDEAEKYLLEHAKNLQARAETDAVRRIHHLLAVCSSLKGEWDFAVRRFLRVLRTPISNVLDVDAGDCAAAYWLGDLYAMQNRRSDALVAYSIAERSPHFADTRRSDQIIISAEQSAVRPGGSMTEITQLWYKKTQPNNVEAHQTPGFIDPTIITYEATMLCLGNESRKLPGGLSSVHLDQNRTRCSYLDGFSRMGFDLTLYEQTCLKIHARVFEASSPWPLQYDPLICIANIQHGRLFAEEEECDAISSLQHPNPETRPPRPLLSLGKLDTFTSPDLPWLIQTLRASLTTLEISWSETSTAQSGSCQFRCRYQSFQHSIASTNYFTISVFKHSLRSGYAVDICSSDTGGVCSARILRRDVGFEKGVLNSEARRIRKLVRSFLEAAAKSRRKAMRISTAAWDEVAAAPAQAPPPLPPRPASAQMYRA